MRDVNRIEPFLKSLGEKWKQHFPDWRFGQLLYNFFAWLMAQKGIDPFFPEEEKLLVLFDEFINETITQ